MMTVSVTPSQRDLRTMLDIVNADPADLPPDGLPLPVLDALCRLIPAALLSFIGLDSGGQTDWFIQRFPSEEPGDDDDAAFWAHYSDCAPCSYPDRSGDVRSITKISDFYSARQWHATAMYHDYFHPAGIDHELMLCLPAGPGRTLRLVFFRGPGPDFSERDRALLALLRPHLHQVFVEAERRRGSLPQLTRRQWELLRLVAAGHTNLQISHRLGVSEGTVRKHLENIYGRLQVSSRTAAVTRAFPEQHHRAVALGEPAMAVVRGP
jgi:DNA-binding CsgD family transcriptional regulator